MSVCSDKNIKSCADSSWGKMQVKNIIYVSFESFYTNDANSSVGSNNVMGENIKKFEEMSLKCSNN
jgi:hypothetical protein